MVEAELLQCSLKESKSLKNQYGICDLSVINIYEQADAHSSVVNQMLYGDHYKINEVRKHYLLIELQFDKSKGWIHRNQFHPIAEDNVQVLNDFSKAVYNDEPIGYVIDAINNLRTILFGARMDAMYCINHHNKDFELSPKTRSIPELALTLLNTPFMQGGRSTFGVDSSGFTQLIYKNCDIVLYRSVKQQSEQGIPLSFIEESKPGDLAFFDTKEGIIHHVGIILPNNYIIHAFGKVRIDRIDHTGIFNPETKQYTHHLRVIKSLEV